MPIVKDKPKDIPTGNDLDNVEDPDEQPAGPPLSAAIYLSGAEVASLPDAPHFGERFQLLVELEVIEEGVKSLDGGQTRVQVRRCRRIGDMWIPGGVRPPVKKTKAAEDADAAAEAAENQPPLYPVDETGQPADDVDHDEIDPDDEDQDDGGDYGRPGFSDAEQ
jgi:hypothetical protein